LNASFRAEAAIQKHARKGRGIPATTCRLSLWSLGKPCAISLKIVGAKVGDRPLFAYGGRELAEDLGAIRKPPQTDVTGLRPALLPGQELVAELLDGRVLAGYGQG
jgi:hypothetical protein